MEIAAGSSGITYLNVSAKDIDDQAFIQLHVDAHATDNEADVYNDTYAEQIKIVHKGFYQTKY